MTLHQKTRAWLGVSFAIWVAVSIAYYFWLFTHSSVLENQNRVFKSHLGVKDDIFPRTDTYQQPVIPDSSGTVCETIHISLVCMGKCTRQVTPMLKSILHHRQNPLHFHLIVDDASKHIMETLFDTWILPDVQYSCYSAEPYLSKVRWIPNSHYSGIFSLVKLLLPEILPEDLEKVIALDTDLTFMSDVAELWAMFQNMTDDQLIGLVENESDWYLDTEKHWPAVGRGFNMGVVLMWPPRMRRANWAQLWRRAVTDYIARYKQTTLADQDVINGVIKNNPRILYNVSCRYNVQMSTNTIAKACYGEDVNNVKIVHWNSPLKHNIGLRDAPYFRSVHRSYVNMDGDLLREKLHRCWTPDTAI